ncbi:MAG: hypothetical protein P9L94_07540 [Candidatus Hinthialibacter antarcticus]|nr:hypothetical protein [Candidatus Hinthialibacter antarcticus]
MKKALQIAFFEARMSSRGWRFWLLLMLALGISLFARRDYAAYAEYGYFLSPAYSFVHPSFGLMLSVFFLGTVALALDVCGRLRRTRMDQIVFPLPVSSMALMWGRLLGVLIIMLPVSAFGLFSLAIWQVVYGHSGIIWQPFALAYFLIVIPYLVPIAALLITLRTFWKHDFAALLGAGTLCGVLGYFGFRYGMVINASEIWQQLGSASPTLGARVNSWEHLYPAGAQLLTGLLLLYLAPLYLRRQELQQWVKVRGKRYGLFGVPNLMRWITNLRFDRHLGFGYRLSLITLILVTSGGIFWAANSLRENARVQESFDPVGAAIRQAKIKPPEIDLKTVAVRIEPDGHYRHLDVEAVLDFTAQGAVTHIDLELDPRYHVYGARMDGEPVFHEQWDEVLSFDLEEPLQDGSSHQIIVRYQGSPSDLHPKYSALEQQWFPLPWNRVRTESRRWVRQEDDIFEADLELHLQPQQRGAFSGELVSVDEENGSRIEHWRTFQPVPTLQLYWGAYQILDAPDDLSRMRFYHLPTHEYQAWIYMQEVQDQEEYLREKLGRLPFPQLTIIEKPYVEEEAIMTFDRWSRWSVGRAKPQRFERSMPGQIAILENQTRYLHEGVWQLDRMDADPTKIQFYRLLSPARVELQTQYFNRLIETYYKESLNPVGELSFWIQDYLSSYAAKMLNPNTWSRRREMNYDVGDSRERPLSIAQSSTLLDLRANGGYPELERARGEGLFRMLHHLMGDDAWWQLQKDIFRDFRFRSMTADDLLNRAEAIHGEDLSWFKEQWVYGDVLPEYEITIAESQISEDKMKFTLEYNIVIQVKNHGSGRMFVPIYIETEGDYIFRDIELDADDINTLALTTPNRPIMAAVDPEHWVLQIPFRDEQKNKRFRSEKRINIDGEEASALSQGSQRGRRGRRRGGWRF